MSIRVDTWGGEMHQQHLSTVNFEDWYGAQEFMFQQIAKGHLCNTSMIDSNVEHMLDNAAGASQHRPLLDDKVVRGAILRSIYQWMDAEGNDTDLLKTQLKKHSDFNS